MSADLDIIRKAAETLRERAGSAGRSDPAPWTREAETGWRIAPVLNADGQYIFTGDDGHVCGEASTETAAYIATMGPDVGLALAELLDVLAGRAAEVGETITNQRVLVEVLPSIVLGYTQAVAIARLIVGEQS